MEYSLNVPASRGRMGDSEFYTAVVPVGAAVKLFAFDPEKMAGLSPEQRTQRALKRKRVPEIAEYILEHEDYVFSSLTVSIEDAGRITFQPVEGSSDIGMLTLPLDCEFTVNDGQHRMAGIAEAVAKDKELEHDTISVVIFPGSDRRRSQQIFSDLNRTVHKTSRSLDILFDHRLPTNQITVDLAESMPLFHGRIDKERVALSGRSKEFTTLAGLQTATEALLGAIPEHVDPEQLQQQYQTAVRFWTTLTEIVEPWDRIVSGDLRPDEARQEYISVYSLILWALGSVGGTLLRKKPNDWEERLGGLRNIDWRKTNQDWQGICMVGHEVVTRGPARKAASDYLHWKLKLGPRPAPVLGVLAPPRAARGSAKKAAGT